VLVTHAGVIRVLVAHHRRLPTQEWTSLHFDFGSRTIIEHDS
jgi:broad specificity phosphatase PhoE